MSETFEIAHIREQGIDLIIVPLKPEYERKRESEKQAIIATLQACAHSAGLAGTVVPVWERLDGRMAFIAPQRWHPFFSSLSMLTVATMINKKLTCG